CTNGPGILTNEQKQILASRDIVVSEQSVSAFHGSDGKLRLVEFTDGSRIERTGGFIAPKWVPRAGFQQELGYAVNDLGGILTDEMGKSTVPGLFAAGEVTTGFPSQLIVAAAAGSIAAASINLELTEEAFSS
ncbi:FAD-dependent oxidoreductase, partial [Priestia megaterium]